LKKIKVKFLNPFSRSQEDGFLIKDPLFCGGYKIESGNSVFSRILIKYFKADERRRFKKDDGRRMV
jgi:hypothetical protein